ncbi:hypothetical protein HC891_01835 [Candidatus Gracilibacteria bacterium]|nr:hypothetical protein [Candidatus Gracilibacteria bacterium]
MSEATQQPQTEEPHGPPLPKWAYNLVNPAMMAVLRSPLHRPLSDSLMILIFEGRKSGKRYMIPVGYLQEGDKLYIFSHRPWSKNFIGGAPIGLRLRGELRRGLARVTEDAAVIDMIIGRMIAERGEGMAIQMGFADTGPDGRLKLKRPRGTTFIEITLTGGWPLLFNTGGRCFRLQSKQKQRP